VSLAIFDLDNTLLAGDSDYEWGRFLADRGVVEPGSYERENRRFYAQYQAGTLDIHEFARFAFKPLAGNPFVQLQCWREEFLEERIRPIILSKARALVEGHRICGRTILIITSTNRFITEPIAREFGVEHLLASEPEFKAGCFTGELSGIPCFREGKVTRVQTWLDEQKLDLKDSWFYTDSHNDIPLLERVSHPVAVDADPKLTQIALQRGWQLISLR
jgi:HAD superfamily hydrolase (TIGR01490 family)